MHLLPNCEYVVTDSCPKCGPYLDDDGNDLETEWANVSLVYPFVAVVQSLAIPVDDDYVDDEEVLHRAAHFLAGEFGVEVGVFYAGIQEVMSERAVKIQVSSK